MTKFKVLRPIEHNQKLYVPERTAVPAKVKSAGNGQEIPSDASGAIELTGPEAARLLDGRIEPLKAAAEPNKPADP